MKMKQITLIVLVYFVHVLEAYGVNIHRTTQALTPECLQHLQQGECPLRHLPQDEEYRVKLNRMCCSQYPGTTLHCQQGTADTTVTVFPACLPRTRVPMGNYGVLGEKGDPEFEILPCNRESYEMSDRQSDDRNIEHCSHQKTRCSGEGQRLLCRAGPTRDDRCVCDDGYRPHPDNADCRKGYFTDLSCICRLDPCPSGMARYIPRPQNDSCDDTDIEVNYTCRWTGVPGEKSSDDDKPHSAVDTGQLPANTTEGSRQMSGGGVCVEYFGICLSVVILVVAVTALATLLCYIKRKKIRRLFDDTRRKVCERFSRSDARTTANDAAETPDSETEMSSMVSSSSTP
ncbi:uncharacterized protein LOC112575091 isoform X2 [Pomacea canaliculata]|nr:uncharacterized protein LOC112575091 isoform X2 [Pomacea canaliculata]XP_025112448.1 uncharacterized protein LOC112575091 isoform X2 [Pomacea canaliculata]